MILAAFRLARLLASILLGPLALGCLDLDAQSPPPTGSALEFDAANKLYEQGRYTEASGAYEQLIRSGHRSAAAYFNLGNSWFKANQVGRAIASWRQAENLAPRDPDVRANLKFARNKVSGADTSPSPAWHGIFSNLTLNEWTLISSALVWLWFSLLALGEVRPALRETLRGYTATAGVAAIALVSCALFAAHLKFNVIHAIVAAPNAIVRSGPLEEAKVLHQLRDGIEVVVLSEKSLLVNDQQQTWLQITDRSKRSGWLKSDQVVTLTSSSPKI